MRPSCGGCRFWLDLENKQVPTEGLCRRHPPVQLVELAGGAEDIRSYITTGFPVIGRDDWCGEFQAIEIEREE